MPWLLKRWRLRSAAAFDCTPSAALTTSVSAWARATRAAAVCRLGLPCRACVTKASRALSPKLRHHWLSKSLALGARGAGACKPSAAGANVLPRGAMPEKSAQAPSAKVAASVSAAVGRRWGLGRIAKSGGGNRCGFISGLVGAAGAMQRSGVGQHFCSRVFSVSNSVAVRPCRCALSTLLSTPGRVWAARWPLSVRRMSMTRRSLAERLRWHRPLASRRSSMRVMAPASSWQCRASSAAVEAVPEDSLSSGSHCALVNAEPASSVSTDWARLTKMRRIR